MRSRGRFRVGGKPPGYAADSDLLYFFKKHAPVFYCIPGAFRPAICFIVTKNHRLDKIKTDLFTEKTGMDQLGFVWATTGSAAPQCRYRRKQLFMNCMVK